MNLLVLGGGGSPEREVSLRSAEAIAGAAKSAGFEPKTADPIDGFSIFDGIEKNTIVLPILHGEGGEDGVIQAEMEKRGLSFLGADSESSRVCFDKWLTRQLLEQNNVLMPRAERVKSQTYKDSELSLKPHVLKVLHGGSSIGTVIFRNSKEVSERQIKGLFKLENDAVVEELIEGVEITIPILDEGALVPIEIVPPNDGEFDYENKYNGKAQELCPPPSLDDEQIMEAQEIAEKVHRITGVRHLSRVDMMLGKDRRFYVLEINTMPGLTDQSLFPKSAAFAGLSMPKLVEKFVEMVRRDYSL